MTVAVNRFSSKFLFFLMSLVLVTGVVLAADDYDAGLKLIREEGFKSIDPAIEKFRMAIKANASNIPARMALADALIMKYELSEKKDTEWLKNALENLNEVLRLRPGHPMAYFSMANALLDLGKEEEGAKYLRKAVLARPEDEKINIGYFGWLLSRSRLDDAVRFADESKKYFHKKPEIFRTYGELFLRSGNAGKALPYLQLAESEGVKGEDFVLVMADTLKMNGKYADALVCYEKIIKSDSGNQAALFGASYCCAETGNLNKAAELMEKSLASNPADPAIMNNLALYYEKLNRVDDARKLWEKIRTMSSASESHKQRAISHLNSAGKSDNK
ncbi:MAG: tetratricopeptide repeat protein [Kiritimatiellae bacterium]|nr:tetratricopeptide repeat protein [Kiritimatiellia bacterium]MDD5519417.1 tetratricopeptide repeat protein [Kiritimatiellia bacterium]